MSNLAPMPTATLSNGLVVANFSSPHQFTFTDGTILDACTEERSRTLMLKANEREFDNGRWTDLILEFEMSQVVVDALVEAGSVTYKHVDIVIVPLPVMKAMGGVRHATTYCKKARSIRMADRITKTIHIDRWCME